MPATQDVIYATTHTISCEAAGMPTPVVFIRKPDDSKVISPYTVESFTEQDIGLYRCVAVNPANGAVAVQTATYTLTSLHVTVSPSAPTVDKSSTDYLSFTCSVLGTPTYTSLNWLHKNPCSDEIIPITGTEPGFSFTSPNVLTIQPFLVNVFLPGDYICSVQRYSIEFSSSATLTVTSITDTVSINSPLSTLNCPDLSQGLQRQFQCSAISAESNPITYTWFLNQENIDPGSDTTRISLNSDGYGNYRCVATAGQTCDYEESSVDGGLSVDIEYVHSTLLKVEESITISCIATGYPAISYTWMKDGSPIIGQTDSVFMIGAVTIADSGVYTCSAGVAVCTDYTTSSGVSIVVTQTSPSISTSKSDFEIEIGFRKTLTCTGTGIPTPNYQWYRDSVPIQNAESNTYTITSASTSDNGLYACELYSYVERSYQEISQITIFQIPYDIQISGAPEGYSIIGDTVILTCSAGGIPAPWYKWYGDDGILLVSDATLEIIVDGESEYSCLADNGKGVLQDSVAISIEPEPSNLLIILPVVLGISALIVFSIMICVICLMWVYNFKRVRSGIKGEIAGDSGVLLDAQADHIITPYDDIQNGSEISVSKASSPSIIGPLDNIDVGKMGGLDRSNPLSAAQLEIVNASVEAKGGCDGDNELNIEFESTPSNMAKWTTMPQDSEIKNRYMNVLPNQSTMVELSDTGESGSTFINANFVSSYKSKKSVYIATQGPLPSTIIDFWRMVWENDVSAVIMTCLLFERKRIRCARYWPDTQQRPTEIYGHFKVSIDSYARADDYEVSLLYLVNLKAGPNEVQKKQVYHYWYKSWPSYGVPKETNKIWKFLEEVNSNIKDTNNPILIHCSAGIGRTAVFIGCDMGMREFKSTNKVDPLKYLCLLRKGRGGSIQTPEQYYYMHRVLADFIAARPTAI